MAECEEVYTFGRWVRAWRTQRGLSIKGAAQHAGWQPQFWSNIEQERRARRGGLPPKPDDQTVIIIARVLNLPAKVALIAAGHSPADWRVQLCRMLPPSDANEYLDPPPFPDATLSLQNCDQPVQAEKSENRFVVLNELNENLQIEDKKPAVWDESVLQRLGQVEKNVEYLVLAIDAREEIRNFAEAIRRRGADKTS